MSFMPLWTFFVHPHCLFFLCTLYIYQIKHTCISCMSWPGLALKSHPSSPQKDPQIITKSPGKTWKIHIHPKPPNHHHPSAPRDPPWGDPEHGGEDPEVFDWSVTRGCFRYRAYLRCWRLVTKSEHLQDDGWMDGIGMMVFEAFLR